MGFVKPITGRSYPIVDDTVRSHTYASTDDDA